VNAIHKAVERSKEQHDNFEQSLQNFQQAKSLSPERQSIAEEAMLAAAGRVAKSDDAVSRAVDRLKI